MDLPREIAPLVSQYAFVAQTVQFVQSLNSHGGFSGAALWKIQAADEFFCLRRWPAAMSEKRLEFIHTALQFAQQRGIRFLPVPITAADGRSFVNHQGELWELAVWLPGAADFHRNPSPQRLAAAMTALARLHRAWETFPVSTRVEAVSPGIQARLALLREFQTTKASRIAASLSPGDWPELVPLGRQVIERFYRFAPAIHAELTAAASLSVRLQPVIRDLWHDHVLFTGDEVTGIVDFGAMRMDTVVGDLARLLGSFLGDDAPRWETAVAAYETTGPLTLNERRLLPVFDRSTSLLAGMNWLDWIYLDRRTFPNRPGVAARLTEILRRGLA